MTTAVQRYGGEVDGKRLGTPYAQARWRILIIDVTRILLIIIITIILIIVVDIINIFFLILIYVS